MKGWLGFSILFFSVIAYSSEPSNPKIISLTPSFTDLVVGLGATDQLVGATLLDKQRIPALSNLDSIGNFGSYSIEKIVSLKPDMILIWPSALTATQQQQISSLGIKVINRDPQTLDDLVSDTLYLANLIGKEQEGKELAKQLQNELQQLKAKYYREKPQTVFYQVWGSPIYTIGKKQIINDALHVCGAKNIFDDIESPAPQVNIESILARNPEIIIASQQSLLDAWLPWSGMAAVKNKKLILFKDDRIARPSIDMVEAIKILCLKINE